jgi:hypothetical protein
MEDHGNIYEALLAFQAEMPVIAKTATNPHFKSKYAGLPEISEQIIPLLNKHGIIYLCGGREGAEGKGWFIGRLLHAKSDTLVDGEIPLFGADPQKLGSAITYYRRYMLGMLTGVITDEDDDGNLASRNTVKATNANKDKILNDIATADSRERLLAVWTENRLGNPGTDAELVQAAKDKGEEFGEAA